ncbi:MAG: type II toxin-antitoxin system PemK/MazF family toxin [Pleurocapsa sp. MO_226.B13]|nr:type II toxin-antitoxin system PemK/MazF family toxin [Pleurocapsa sp. MO_226.B13]
MKCRRGEIWWIDLDPTRGKEARKIRACLIIQNDIGNEESDLTTVIPFLSPKSYPFVVNVQPSDLNQLDKERGLHFNQIRSVDTSGLKSKLGTLESKYFDQIKRALDIQFGFF